MSPSDSITITLSASELGILVQSLGSCLETCKEKAAHPDAPCKDCDAARTLRDRLQKNLAA